MLRKRKGDIKDEEFCVFLVMRLFVVSLFLFSLLSCAVPVKETPPITYEQIEYYISEEQYDIALEVIKELQKEHPQDRRLRYYAKRKIAELQNPPEIEITEEEPTERELLLLSFTDSDIILKAFEQIGLNVFDVAGFLNEYKSTDIDGFCDYLGGYKHKDGAFVEGQYPFNTKSDWWLDREIFIPAKRNHKLLKRVYKDKKPTDEN